MFNVYICMMALFRTNIKNLNFYDIPKISNYHAECVVTEKRSTRALRIVTFWLQCIRDFAYRKKSF